MPKTIQTFRLAAEMDRLAAYAPQTTRYRFNGCRNFPRYLWRASGQYTCETPEIAFRNRRLDSRRKMKRMKTSKINPSNSTQPILVRRALPWAAALFALVSSLSSSQAVDPPPDGDYGNFNTAEGGNALLNLNVNSGNNNTALGSNALTSDVSGSANTAVGSGALADNTASNNTAVGFQSLLRNTTGTNNTAFGINALLNNTTLSSLTAIGANALSSNTTGYDNTAVGNNALLSNTQGASNIAIGNDALNANTTGNFDIAVGVDALRSNINGQNNIAIGVSALVDNVSGHDNVAIGGNALLFSSSGSQDTAVGAFALQSNKNSASSNTAVGSGALMGNSSGNNNTGLGVNALHDNTGGSGNIAVGFQAGSLLTGSNNIDIGNKAIASESGKIRIGTKGTHNGTFIAGIFGKTSGSGTPVFINSNGLLGTVQSSARFKDDIKPMDKASEVLLELKPVIFRYKEELDPDKIPQFGLIAEEVEKVNRDLVVYDEDGKVMTVRYDSVNAMLLNEFLKEHRTVEEEQANIEQLQSSAAKQQAVIAKQQKQIDALAAGLQKVSARAAGLRSRQSKVVTND